MASQNIGNIGAGTGLSPDHCQAIIWTNADLLSVGPLATNPGEFWIKIDNFDLR